MLGQRLSVRFKKYEEFKIFSSETLFFGLAFLWKAKQGVSSSISFFLTIIGSELVSKKLFGKTDLMGAQSFCIYELAEIIMVDQQKNLVFTAFQVMAPSFESLKNGEKFLMLRLVARLYRNDLFRKKDD